MDPVDFDDLEQRVRDEGGLYPISMQALREFTGWKRLDAGPRAEIRKELEVRGLAVRTPRGRSFERLMQEHWVLVYAKSPYGNPAYGMVEAILNPDETSRGRILRGVKHIAAQYGDERTAELEVLHSKLDQIKSIVTNGNILDEEAGP